MNQTQDSNNRLKRAVNSVAAPPFLEARIRANLQGAPPARSWRRILLAASVAAAALAMAIYVPYQNGYFRFTRGMQETYIVSLTSKLVSLMGPGLADHIICSVFRKYPKDAPPVETLMQKLPEDYHELIPIVQATVPSQYQLLITHQCRFRGRRFVHLSWEDNRHVLSLVITRRNQGEAFQAEGLLPALIRSDIPMYQSGVQAFAMTAFETPDFLVYFVSDLPQEENTRLMAAMAPGVKSVLSKMEL